MDTSPRAAAAAAAAKPPTYHLCDFCLALLPEDWHPWACEACGLDYITCVACRESERRLWACHRHPEDFVYNVTAPRVWVEQAEAAAEEEEERVS